MWEVRGTGWGRVIRSPLPEEFTRSEGLCIEEEKEKSRCVCGGGGVEVVRRSVCHCRQKGSLVGLPDLFIYARGERSTTILEEQER